MVADGSHTVKRDDRVTLVHESADLSDVKVWLKLYRWRAGTGRSQTREF